jgi:hypothetical protein
MCKITSELGFAHELGSLLRITRRLGMNLLERHFATHRVLARSIDDAHSPGADLFEEFIVGVLEFRFRGSMGS